MHKNLLFSWHPSDLLGEGNKDNEDNSYPYWWVNTIIRTIPRHALSQPTLSKNTTSLAGPITTQSSCLFVFYTSDSGQPLEQKARRIGLLLRTCSRYRPPSPAFVDVVSLTWRGTCPLAPRITGVPWPRATPTADHETPRHRRILGHNAIPLAVKCSPGRRE